MGIRGEVSSSLWRVSKRLGDENKRIGGGFCGGLGIGAIIPCSFITTRP